MLFRFLMFSKSLTLLIIKVLSPDAEITGLITIFSPLYLYSLILSKNIVSIVLMSFSLSIWYCFFLSILLMIKSLLFIVLLLLINSRNFSTL